MNVPPKRQPGMETYVDQEQVFVMRVPQPAAAMLASEIDSATNLKDKLSIEMQSDHRHATVRYAGQIYQGRMVDMPCVLEALKTTDRKTFYKTADISQMLICSQGEASPPPPVTVSPSKKEETEEKKYQYNHGITPPLKNVRKRRFRKTMKLKYQDMPKIDREVKRLLRVDQEAEKVEWELVTDTRPLTANESAAPVDDTLDGTGLGSVTKDNTNMLGMAEREIFGYISDSDEEEISLQGGEDAGLLSTGVDLAGSVLDSAAAAIGLDLNAELVDYNQDENAQMGYEEGQDSYPDVTGADDYGEDANAMILPGIEEEEQDDFELQMGYQGASNMDVD